MAEGQVVAAFGRQFLVELADGTTLPCITRGKKGGVACGDRVIVQSISASQGIIDTIAPRTSLLYRSDAFREKIIAANVTQIIVVLAAEPAFYEDLLNRCLIAAETADIKALIVLNKCDLENPSQQALQQLALYAELGYPLLPLSALQDIAPLRPWLHGQTSVLVGQSGMGKSSIVNALLPDIQARTREISQALNSGKHTTTHAQLYHLDADSHIIDSPGLQEFGLHHMSRDAITHAFVEFRPYIGDCRFANCKHLVEPDCAVRNAVATGKISERRLAAYQRLAP
ncbi:MAG: ribosome small subunit-dependent GTPase A [Sulfuricella sp.]|nr:ribosome small subunit-dependent GTPase A [Sulfuricella sp.]